MDDTGAAPFCSREELANRVKAEPEETSELQ